MSGVCGCVHVCMCACVRVRECANVRVCAARTGYASFDYEPAPDREADVVMVSCATLHATCGAVCGQLLSLLLPSPWCLLR